MRFSLFTLALASTLLACEPADDPAVDTAEPVESATTTQETDAEIRPMDAGPINLNTATSEEFATIPGVGERMVHEFEEYRPYVSIEQFRREIGKYVDEDQVAAYEEYVFVPVDPNGSDEATMQQIPGVGPDESAELAARRPYNSVDEFMRAYAEVVSAPDTLSARAYLAE